MTETVSVASKPTDWTTTLNFAGFNSFATGGTLQSVTFALTESLTGSAFATNNGTSDAVGKFVIQNTATLNAGSLGTVVNSQSSVKLTIAPNATSPTQNISGSNTASTTTTTGLSAFLGAYSGTGSDSALEALSFSGGNLASTFTDSGALSVLVTYTYDATPPSTSVPEPGSVAMLGMALLGLGCVRFKRA